jgi:hypothetical protein
MRLALLTLPFLVAVALSAGELSKIEPGFELQTLDTAIVNPWLKTVGDLDGDGRTDIAWWVRMGARRAGTKT